MRILSARGGESFSAGRFCFVFWVAADPLVTPSIPDFERECVPPELRSLILEIRAEWFVPEVWVIQFCLRDRPAVKRFAATCRI